MHFIADMHTHTVASTHAFSTITENSIAAKKAGLKILAMTDHGVAMPDSPHEWHFYSMRNIPRVLNDVFILRGMEANIIDYNGNIDVAQDDDNEMYDCLDWIVASFHHPCCPPGTKAQHTKAYIGALQNPYVDCIGHSESVDFDYDFREVARVCREKNRAIELNAARLRGREAQTRYREIMSVCAEEGAKIVVNSDAHFYDRIGDFKQAEQFLAEMKFPHELILNIDERRVKDYILCRRNRNIFE